MFKNIKNDLITTVIGIGLLLFSGLMIWKNQETIQIASLPSVMMLVGLSFLVSKDTIITKIINKILDK